MNNNKSGDRTINKIFGTFFIYAIIALAVLSISGIVTANDNKIDKILKMETMPDGVVFEVVSGNENYLKIALSKFDVYQKRLKEKFPNIELAIVTHGSEQFALTKANKKKYEATHQKIQKISNDDVPVHICETHAGWRNVTAQDFPDYVNVSATGPSQIKQYQELGYILIIL